MAHLEPHSNTEPLPARPVPPEKTAPGRKEAPLSAKMAAKKRAWARKPDILKTHHRLMLGDARSMPGLDPASKVHLVVTSPPYWDLKEYRDDLQGAQLGHIAARDAFMNELGKVWKRSFDMLETGGRLCVVVGDVCRSRKKHGRHVVEPLHAYIQMQCEAIGFDPLAPIIWNKIANMRTEMGGSSAFLGKPYEPNAIIKNDIEFILMFRKPGGYRHPTQEQRDLSFIDKQDHQRWFRQIWDDVRGDSTAKHPAPFPIEVPLRLISMFSFVGDTVLDPFCGTGSTTIAAMQTHRSSIGFEIDPEYFAYAQERIGFPTEDSTLEFVSGQDMEAKVK